MLLTLASSLLFIGQVASPPVSAEQLRELIRAKTAPLKSLVFIYDGRDRWIGDPKLAIGGVQNIDREFQGTFLFRGDRAGLCDVYATSFAQGGVVRRKSSILDRRMEVAVDLLDAKQKLGPTDIKKMPGFLTELTTYDAPLNLVPLWRLEDLIDNLFHEIAIDGWDTVAGRTCLRVRASILGGDKDRDRERNKQFYWLDLERNAQVLKTEFYRNGNLDTRIDQIQLLEQILGDKTSYWLPVFCRVQGFDFGGLPARYSKEPVFEGTLAVVNGSMKINLDLPDSLFTVKRDSAYPTPDELAGNEARVNAGPLARKFQERQSPSPPPPNPTDPISVRNRIENGLAEANRQSKELEASSPARQTWNATTIIQVVIGGLGVALLAYIAVKKWRGE